MPRCALCEMEINETVGAGGIRGKNPKTRRKAWMHISCAIEVLETLRGQPSKDPRYDSQYDEFIQEAAGE